MPSQQNMGRQSFERAQLQSAQFENVLQNCSGASRASSQYHTCSALHRRSQGVQQEIQNKLPPTEWLPGCHRLRKRTFDHGDLSVPPTGQSSLFNGMIVRHEMPNLYRSWSCRTSSGYLTATIISKTARTAAIRLLLTLI